MNSITGLISFFYVHLVPIFSLFESNFEVILLVDEPSKNDNNNDNNNRVNRRVAIAVIRVVLSSGRMLSIWKKSVFSRISLFSLK